MRSLALLSSALVLPGVLLLPGWARAEDPAPASGRFFEAYDTNGDGEVTAAEFGGDGQVFRLLDEDGDGVITPTDLGLPADFRPRRAPQPTEPRPEAPGGEAGSRAERLRERIRAQDANADGKVARDEWQGPDEMFASIDRDGDGFLDAAEIDAVGSGGGRRGDRMARMREMLLAMDADGDGRVSAEEYSGRFPFERLDRNSDGFLDDADFEGMGGGPRRPPPAAPPGAGPDAPERGPMTPGEGEDAKPPEDAPPPTDRRPRGPVDPAQLEERFRGIDKNGDGTLDAEELPRPDAFQRLDTDGDGSITLEEFVAVMTARTRGDRRPAGAGGPGRRTRRGLSEQAFRRFDTDNDGRVTREEFPGGDDRFDHLDANGDGVLTDADRNAPSDAPSDAPADAPDAPPTGEALTEHVRLLVERDDVDGDGRVSRREFQGDAEAFDALDKNHDGYVDPQDLP